MNECLPLQGHIVAHEQIHWFYFEKSETKVIKALKPPLPLETTLVTELI